MRHARPLDNEAERGQTLIETAIACVLLVVIYGAGLSLSVEARDTWSHLYHDTGALQAVREGLRRLATELAASAPGHVTVTTGEVHDAIEFQVPVELEGDEITWGAEGTAGLSVRVAVEDGTLVRRVVDDEGQTVGRPRRLVANVDDLYRGQKGFEVALVDSLCTVRLRVRAEQEGRVWRQQVSTGIRLRN